MSIKITIKLDAMKIRVYLESNDVTINELENYLKKQSYKNVDDCLKIESNTRAQKPSGYSLEHYSMAYKTNGSENNKMLTIEAWFKLAKHFNDETLATAIENLIKPVLPPINEDIIPKPNMKVGALQSRSYVTVFQQDEAALDDVLQLVYNFESIVVSVRKQIGLESEQIPSDVTIAFENKIPPAFHAEGLKIFGLMPARNNFSNSAPISAYTSSNFTTN